MIGNNSGVSRSREPEPEPKEHCSHVALRANDFDAAGHLNNSVYPQLMESGRWEWGIANGADMRDSSLIAVVLQLHLDYLETVDWDPTGHLVVRTALARKSPYSFTLTQDIERSDGTVVAKGHVKLGLIDRRTKQIHRADMRALLNTPARVS